MLKQRISNLKSMVNNYNLDDAVCELIDICNEYEVLEDVIFSYVDDEMINNIIKGFDDWSRIAIFLSGVNYLNNEFYHLDGYGNLEEIKSSILMCDIEDLETELSEILEIESKAYDAFIELKELTDNFEDFDNESLEYNYIESTDEYVINYGDYILIDNLFEDDAITILDNIYGLIDNEE